MFFLVFTKLVDSQLIMFTGEVPGKRRINLGGKAGIVADKQRLLEQSRKDREERDNFRRRGDACNRIARIYKGHLSRRKTEYWLIELLENRVPELQSKTAVETENVLTIIFLLNKLNSHNICQNPALLATVTDWYESLAGSLLSGRSVVRVSALVQQLLQVPSLSQRCIPFVKRLIGQTFAFIPKSAKSIIKLFELLHEETAVALLTDLLERSDESILMRKCSLAFLQSRVGMNSLGILPRIPIVGQEDLALRDFDYNRISRNLISVIFRLLQTGDTHLVKRLMMSVANLVEVLASEERADLESYLVAEFLTRDVPGQYILFEVVRLELLSEETVYKLATQTTLVEQIGKELIYLFQNRPADGRIIKLITQFTLLYSRVVAGVSPGYTSVLSVECLESLFPLLNKFAYESVIRFSPVSENVFELIRAVYSKKHMFPKIRSDNVWVIPESVSYIPHSIHGYDLTINSEVDVEMFHEEEGMGSETQTAQHTSVFDVLIEYMPHAIAFDRRLRIFAAALAEDQLRHTRQAWSLRLPWEGSRVKKVRRQFLVQDGLEVISSASREVLRIEFVGSDGTVEAGIDGGGLFKEFMQQWTIGIMNPEFGLFVQLPNGRLAPSLEAYKIHPDADRLFKAAGRAVGKALYEMVLLETHLSEAFLSRTLGRPFSLEQLQEIDEGLYRNLKFVNETQSVEDLALSFSVSAGNYELVPNGSELPVTSQNKLRYVLLASWYYLARQLDRPAAAFAAGLSELLPLSRLRIFSPSEINLLISGEQKKGFNVEELKANVVYGGGYSERSSTIKALWEVLFEFSDDDRSAFLAFVTSAPRPPLLGFRVLHPKFGINRVPEADRLPTSSTCANLLKLPDYQDKNLLKVKLLAAIYSQSGFDLS
jgi:ubiquitin-protein ligase E3 C